MLKQNPKPVVFQYGSNVIYLIRALDVFIPVLVLISIVYLIDPNSLHDRYYNAGILGGLIFVIFGQLIDLYQSWLDNNIFNNTKLALMSWCFTWTFLIVFAFLYKDSDSFSRIIITSWGIITPIIFIIYRIICKALLIKIRNHSKNLKKVLIIGAGDLGQKFQTTTKYNSYSGLKVTAFADDDIELKNKKINNIPVITTLDNIKEIVNNNNYNEVYICLPSRAEERIKFILNALSDSTVIVKIIPDLFLEIMPSMRFNYLNGMPIFSVYDTQLNNLTSKFSKRLFDITFALCFLFFTFPVYILITIGVKLSSPGPIIYKQTRISWNGKKFEMLKFRSMEINLEKKNETWGDATNKKITPFGKFIRKTSLDELPQFFNVIKGDMSIVGPRPERDIYVKEFRKKIPKYMQKHMVRAGITGWAQIHGLRGDTSIENRIKYDLNYINSWSFLLDIKIIIMTVFKIFNDKSAI